MAEENIKIWKGTFSLVIAKVGMCGKARGLLAVFQFVMLF